MIYKEQFDNWCICCVRFGVFNNEMPKEERMIQNKICSSCRRNWQCKDVRKYYGESPLNYKEK